MEQVINYVYWANASGFDLTFAGSLSDEDHRRIAASLSLKVYEMVHSHRELVALPSYELFQQLIEFIDILKGDDWQSKPYFTKYFNKDDHEVFPKFIFYSGH